MSPCVSSTSHVPNSGENLSYAFGKVNPPWRIRFLTTVALTNSIWSLGVVLVVCVALFLLNYEIGASKGSELHESVVCRYILSTSSLLGLVPQETTFGMSSVDSYSAHPLVNLEKNLFHIIGGTLDE